MSQPKEVGFLHYVINVEKGDNMKLYFVLADIHDRPPNKKSLRHKVYHPALRCAESVIKAYKPDGIIYLGDVTEMESLCHFDANKQRKMEGRRYKRDIDSVKHLLDRHSKLAKEFIYCLGNHEFRNENYVDMHPQEEGLIDYVIDTELLLRGFEVIPYGRVKKLGKALFTHGIDTTKYHSARTAQLYQRTVFYGHVHTHQAFSAVSPVDFKEVRIAQSIPCLCNLNPCWLRNKANAWMHGFGMFWLKDNGEFQMDVKHIIRGECVVNGKIFKG